MVSIPSIPAKSSSSSLSSRTTMPSQIQQHHDNGVRDDINVISNQSNNIMGNTMNNVKNNTHNRQFLFNNHDPQNQQHHNESSYSRLNREDENMLIIDNNDNIKRNDDNEGNNIINYKSNTTINNSNKINNINNNNNHLLISSNSSSFPRRKSSVLDISSLLCELPTNLSYASPSSSVGEDSMDDESSHLGDNESLGSPNKNTSTPATSPPYSPPGSMNTTIDREKRLINTNDFNDNNNENNFHSRHDLRSSQFKNNNNYRQQYHESGRYTCSEQGRFQEDTPWKRPRIMNQDDNSKSLVLPPIRSFTDSDNSNGQFHPSPSSLPSTPLSDHGKINSPVDHHSPQKSWNNLEQFAAITEACRTGFTNSSHSSHSSSHTSHSSHADVRLPPASSLTNNNHSFENNNNSSVQHQSSQHPPLLRRSSFDIPQTTRYSPYTPSTTLNPYMPSRLLSDQRRHSDLSGYTTSPRNDHSENSYLHHHHNNNPSSSSPYGYDRDNRHYVQRSHYGTMHSPPSPNTYSVPHHNGYSISSHNSHHLQISHHHHHHHLGSPYMDPTSSGTMVKAKRKRANASQLKVLNQVFQHTFFPSTELRIQLGKQLGMSPRTVQIWFQNKRQSWRSKSRATTNSSMKDDEGQIDDGNLEVDGDVSNNNDDNLISRRSSNSNLSCSDDDERRSIPNSPMESAYAHSDYFTRNNNSNENNVNNMSSNGNVSTSTQNPYFGQSQHSNNNNNGDYYNHHRSNSVSTGGSSGNGHVMTHHNNTGVITPTSPLPPPSSLTSQLPSPVYSTSSSVSTNERLPPFSTSFAHTPSYTTTTSSNNYDPFSNNRLPAPIMINHRSQAQSSFGYQSAVSSNI